MASESMVKFQKRCLRDACGLHVTWQAFIVTIVGPMQFEIMFVGCLMCPPAVVTPMLVWEALRHMVHDIGSGMHISLGWHLARTVRALSRLTLTRLT